MILNGTLGDEDLFNFFVFIKSNLVKSIWSQPPHHVKIYPQKAIILWFLIHIKIFYIGSENEAFKKQYWYRIESYMNFSKTKYSQVNDSMFDYYKDALAHFLLLFQIIAGVRRLKNPIHTPNQRPIQTTFINFNSFYKQQ